MIVFFIFLCWADRQVGEDVIEMYEEGLISPHVSASFSLDQVNDAIEFLQLRKSTGKVILKIRWNNWSKKQTVDLRDIRLIMLFKQILAS